MEDSIWFQEELESSGLGEAIPTKSAIPETPEAYFDATFHHGAARVIADVPRWLELEDGAVQLRSYPKSRFLLLRLGIQLHPAEHTTNARYSFARCSAMLESDDPLLQPRVHDLYPSEIYNQPEAKISLAISPNLKIGPIEASAGTVSTEILTGYVRPAVAGWPGEEERYPYWNIYPRDRGALGRHHFWLIVEVPKPVQEFKLSVLAEADITDRLRQIRLRPAQMSWHKRPAYSITLQ